MPVISIKIKKKFYCVPLTVNNVSLNMLQDVSSEEKCFIFLSIHLRLFERRR